MNRADGERIRIAHQLDNLRALINGFESSLNAGVGLAENAHSVAHAAGRLLDHACRLDAYRFAERDALPPVCPHCEDKHIMSLGDRTVPCTRCPTPCPKCADYGGTGAYCADARCTCDCHKERP